MKAPSISIAFLEQSSTAVQRGDRGIIAMLLRDSKAADYTVYTVTDVPAALSAANQLQLKMALLGYINTPRKILVHVITDADYDSALGYFATQKWDYLVVPTAETDGQTATISAWIKNQREKMHRTYKAVLSNTAADNEGVVNVANGCVYGSTKMTAEQMCARVAGIIVGTPLSMSCTFAPLTEMTDCDRMAPDELDAAVDAGKLVFAWDGEKVKICRGVNSMTTTNDKKGDSFKKIKLVDAMDMMRDDITRTAEDNYIGRYANNYDNKCLLITAINAYFKTLVTDQVLGSGSAEIDAEKNRQYFKEHGNKLVVDGQEVSLDEATDEQIKKGNTGSYVYLRAHVSLLDAIEDIDLDIYIG